MKPMLESGLPTQIQHFLSTHNTLFLISDNLHYMSTKKTGTISMVCTKSTLLDQFLYTFNNNILVRVDLSDKSITFKTYHTDIVDVTTFRDTVVVVHESAISVDDNKFLYDVPVKKVQGGDFLFILFGNGDLQMTDLRKHEIVARKVKQFCFGNGILCVYAKDFVEFIDLATRKKVKKIKMPGVEEIFYFDSENRLQIEFSDTEKSLVAFFRSLNRSCIEEELNNLLGKEKVIEKVVEKEPEKEVVKRKVELTVEAVVKSFDDEEEEEVKGGDVKGGDDEVKNDEVKVGDENVEVVNNKELISKELNNNELNNSDLKTANSAENSNEVKRVSLNLKDFMTENKKNSDSPPTKEILEEVPSPEKIKKVNEEFNKIFDEKKIHHNVEGFAFQTRKLENVKTENEKFVVFVGKDYKKLYTIPIIEYHNTNNMSIICTEEGKYDILLGTKMIPLIRKFTKSYLFKDNYFINFYKNILYITKYNFITLERSFENEIVDVMIRDKVFLITQKELIDMQTMKILCTFERPLNHESNFVFYVKNDCTFLYDVDSYEEELVFDYEVEMIKDDHVKKEGVLSVLGNVFKNVIDYKVDKEKLYIVSQEEINVYKRNDIEKNGSIVIEHEVIASIPINYVSHAFSEDTLYLISQKTLYTICNTITTCKTEADLIYFYNGVLTTRSKNLFSTKSVDTRELYKCSGLSHEDFDFVLERFKDRGEKIDEMDDGAERVVVAAANLEEQAKCLSEKFKKKWWFF